MKQWIYALWERLVMSLPLLLMSVLALGSYWLVRTVPEAAVTAPVVARSHAPDYFMEHFSVKNFESDGSLHAEVRGAAARHYPDAQWTEVDAIALRSTDVQGRVSEASAAHGLTNEDASELQLTGNAVIVREAQRMNFYADAQQPQPPLPKHLSAQPPSQASPRMEFRGEFLHIFTKEERVRSPFPVELRHGASRFTADALDFDNVTQVLQLNGRVHATLIPNTLAP